MFVNSPVEKVWQVTLQSQDSGRQMQHGASCDAGPDFDQDVVSHTYLSLPRQRKSNCCVFHLHLAWLHMPDCKMSAVAQQPCGPAVTYYFTAWIKQAGVCKSQGISLYQYRANQRCGSGNKVSSLQHFQVLVTKINVLYNLGNNDYAWGEDGGHNTCVSLSCYRIVLWCFLLTELSLKFDICNDRSCIELKHLLWSLMWVRIWKARGIWCSWTESKTVKLSIWLLKSTSRFFFTLFHKGLPHLEADCIRHWI